MSQQLLNNLIALRTKRDEDKGICQVNIKEGQVNNHKLEGLFSTWDKYTGFHIFPIEAESDLSPYRQYMAAKDRLTLWDKTTEYGQLRWELLEHCISELTKEIGETNA